jgi:hypothetical protein
MKAGGGSIRTGLGQPGEALAKDPTNRTLAALRRIEASEIAERLARPLRAPIAGVFKIRAYQSYRQPGSVLRSLGLANHERCFA